MNLLAFILGFCAGAALVLFLFYVHWAQEERRRGDAECARVFGADFLGVL